MTAPAAPRYTTPEAVQDVLAPEGDTAGTAAELGLEAVLAEITAAEQHIDAELLGRYSTRMPFDPVPSTLTWIARDIAAFNCDLTYRGAARFQFGDYDPILMRYRRAIDLLERLSSGRAELDVATAATSTSGGRAGAPRNPHGHLFTPESDLYWRRRRAPADQPWLGW